MILPVTVASEPVVARQEPLKFKSRPVSLLVCFFLECLLGLFILLGTKGALWANYFPHDVGRNSVCV